MTLTTSKLKSSKLDLLVNIHQNKINCKSELVESQAKTKFFLFGQFLIHNFVIAITITVINIFKEKKIER